MQTIYQLRYFGTKKMKYIYIIFFHIFLFILPLKANYTVVLKVIDEGNGFNDIRFKGAFSNWDAVQGYDDGLNGDMTAGDGIWTVVFEGLSGSASYEWGAIDTDNGCLLYTSPSPRDISGSRMPSSA